MGPLPKGCGTTRSPLFVPPTGDEDDEPGDKLIENWDKWIMLEISQIRIFHISFL